MQQSATNAKILQKRTTFNKSYNMLQQLIHDLLNNARFFPQTLNIAFFVCEIDEMNNYF